MINVHVCTSGPVATNTYLLCDTERGVAVVIDAPYASADQVLATATAEGCRITHILLTHTHWDHTADVAPIRARTGASVIVHKADAYRLTDPMDHTVWPLPFTIESVIPDAYVDQGAVLDLEGIAMRVLHTPGHTEGGVCFVHDEGRQVFVGDTLFAGSVGRMDLPGGDEDVLVESIRSTLFMLPDDYVVWPGHGPATSIGRERMFNPFVGEGNGE